MTLVAGCGGGGDAGLPVLPDEDVARLQPGDRPVRFRLDTEVSEEVKRSIVETLTWAHTDLGDSGPLTIHVYSDEEHFVRAYTADYAVSSDEARAELAGGQTAFVSPGGHLWIYLPNYFDIPEGYRRAALFHEYVHTVQDWEAEVRFQSEEPAERSFIPRWLVEGCAEYISIKTGRQARLRRRRRGSGLRRRRGQGQRHGARGFESGGEASFLGGSGEAYTVGWLGCERLALPRPRQGAAHVLAGHGQGPGLAPGVPQAFGQTPADFYRDFAAFRATL